MLSMDAYWMFGTRLGPENAYRFARGDEISFMGEPIRRRRPLDFMAVTDHGVLLGSGLAMEDPDSALATSAVGREFRAGPRRSTWGGAGLRAIGALTAGDVPGFDIASLSRSAWDRIVDAANAFYEPGRFTTFIAYEWTTDNTTSDGAGGPIHRNVIFRGDTAPLPFSSRDSQRPEDLWSYLEQASRTRYRGIGHPAQRQHEQRRHVRLDRQRRPADRRGVRPPPAAQRADQRNSADEGPVRGAPGAGAERRVRQLRAVGHDVRRASQRARGEHDPRRLRARHGDRGARRRQPVQDGRHRGERLSRTC